MQVNIVPMNEIHYDQEFNCRGVINPIDVVDLVKDIEAKTTETDCGLMQPVLIMPHYDKNMIAQGKKYLLIAGYRRFTAFIVLERTSIPAIIKDSMSLSEALALNLCENLKRKDLNILEEARSIKHLFDSGMSRSRICAATGQSDGWVQVRCMVLEMPKEVQEDIKAGFIKQTQIRDLNTVMKKGKPNELWDAVKKIKDAKLRGEKMKERVVIKPKDYNAKRARLRPEILDLMELVRSTFGASLTTRVLAWACGEISDNDLYDHMQRVADEQGKVFNRPV